MLTASRGRTVLLVGVTETFRLALANTLELAGYDVLQASSGSEALSVLEAKEGEVDLVVTAVRLLPGMDGLKLAGEVRRRHPTLAVLYVPANVSDRMQFDTMSTPVQDLVDRVDDVLGTEA